MIAKRMIDIVGSLLALLLLSPVMLAVAVAVVAKIGRPVLFKQVRPGRGGQPFRMIKFRTMSNARDAEGQLLPDAERLGRFGQTLRSASLDELPELWNVLKGDMSLVGPRPLLMAYLDRYTPEQARRMNMRPGVTGWAQINGRNTLGWDEKFALDTWYVDNWSFWLDIRILFLTVWQVLARRGISAGDHVTMPEFLGSPGRVGASVAIIGAGGQGRIAADALQRSGGVLVAYYDDGRPPLDKLTAPLNGGTSEAIAAGNDLHIAIGSNAIRARVADAIPDARCPTIIHPGAQISEHAAVGAGTLVGAGAIIQTGARVGRHVIVNTGAIVEHDCVVGDFVHLAPGTRLAGDVSIGERTLIGIGAVVLPGVTIGADVIIGAGAVVLGDVPDGVTLVGNPARPVRARRARASRAN